ncbi:hypothetical protein V2J52_16635 [Georgenia sp. MJ173]|uniref:hypothetical protein n=1 Tax=Georgenia sunbinii TaxID=3117728 RepID=UPI002F26D966
MSDDDVPSLADLPPTAKRVALAYYEAGLDHGYDLGFRAAEAEQERIWAAFAQVVRAAAATVPYDVLCERRGEPDRAQRQRDLIRRRGVLP